MPRFFFEADTDADTYVVDEEGMELASRDAARAYAVASLRNLAWEDLGTGDFTRCSVTVRDDAGDPFYRATLSLRCRNLD
ncbi:DUF6894 family protein [Roseomonas sp. GCM10028921]